MRPVLHSCPHPLRRRFILQGSIAWLAFALVLQVALFPACSLFAQAGFDDNRVMLQGFYWESSRFGHPGTPQPADHVWYEIVQSHAADIAAANFDLIWLPPPSHAGDLSAGYDPREYFQLDNSYGSLPQQRAALAALLGNGVEPVADLVLNHRNGSTGWADFKNPVWGPWAICGNDEAFSNPASGIANTPQNQRGQCEEQVSYRPEGTYSYPSFRDIAHTDIRVRRDIVRYLLQLQSLGYRGWRYDMVHGYGAQWIALYNKFTHPTFSVGEYDWDKQDQQRGWVWNTAIDTVPAGQDHLRTGSDVFDFETQFSLQSIVTGNYVALYGLGNGIGLVGDTTDGMPWNQRAVTFVENHDTGFRTDPDGTPQKDHAADHFQKGAQVEQAYAYVLTHPGVPCVYWKHYFEWGDDLQNKIKALINARKMAGVNAGSKVFPQDNARQAGVYAAQVTGTAGDLFVRVGGSDEQWQPSNSGISDYRDYAHGDGWKVWVKLPGNPDNATAPHHAAFPLPTYKPAAGIRAPF